MSDLQEYSIYLIRGKSPLEPGIYVGMTSNFASRKYNHKFFSSNENAPQYVNRYIYDNGGWDAFICYEFDKVLMNKEDALAYEGSLIDRFGGTLNKNRSGVSSADFGEYYKNWKADYSETHDGVTYSRQWNDKNPHYHKRYYRAKNDTPEKRDKRVQVAFMKLSRMRVC